MTLQALTRPIAIPEYISVTGSPGFNNGMLLDASTEKAEFVVEAPKTGNLRKIIYRVGTMTTSTTVDCRIETLDKTVIPSTPTGTLWGTNTNGSDSSLVANTIRTITLTADATVTEGDQLAVVIANSATGNFTVSCLNYNNVRYPYTFLNTGARTVREFAPCLAFEYDDGVIYPVLGCYPIETITNNNFNSGSTPDERGMRFQVPFSCRVIGAWWIGPTSSGGGTYAVKIYNNSDSVLLQRTGVDNDVWYASGSNGSHLLRFSGTVDLSAATWYRMTLLPETAADVGLTDFDVDAAAHFTAFELGTNCYYTQRTNAGAWTDTTTKRPYMGLIISHLDDGAGGGTTFAGTPMRRGMV